MTLGLKNIEDGEPLVFDFGRELGAADLAMLGAVNRRSSPPPLERIRARHHALAKALAEGMRPGVAAATYGYSASRVSILQGDPAFKELIEHYRREADHDYARVHERLSALSVEAIDELFRRFEEAPDKLTPAQLAKIIELSADRTGHGPKSSQDVNVNVGFAERLREARKRVQQHSNENVIEGEVVRLPAAE